MKNISQVEIGNESLTNILMAACLAGEKGAHKEDFLQKGRHPYLDTIFSDAVDVGQLEQDPDSWRFKITEKGKDRIAYATGILFNGKDLTPVPRQF